MSTINGEIGSLLAQLKSLSAQIALLRTEASDDQGNTVSLEEIEESLHSLTEIFSRNLQELKGNLGKTKKVLEDLEASLNTTLQDIMRIKIVALPIEETFVEGEQE